MDWKRKVLDAIEEGQDELLELCSQLIRFPTENPPGIRVRLALLLSNICIGLE